MKSPSPEELCGNGVFQIKPLFLVLTFQMTYQNPI